MKCTKDEFFNIKYDEKINVITFNKKKKKILFKLFSKNKFIKVISMFVIVFVIMNIVLIYNFFLILNKF